MLGLYIHIPFCNNICPYCDFYKMVASKETKNKLLDALLQEMKNKKLNNYTFNSVYIGGGTPSSLQINELEKLLSGLQSFINLSSLEEFSIEVNPNDITEELAKILSKYKITRVSIGVQTFNPRLQKIINRVFDKADLENKIVLLNKYNINNINLDLIYAIPSQTIDEFEQDLNEAISINPNHLSVYSLILEEHTIFYHQYLKGTFKLVSEDDEAKMYDLLRMKLRSYDYIHYETSNFAKKGYQSIHNLIYWNCDEYIAIGPAGSSYYNNYRITNINKLDKYYDYVYNNNEIFLEKELITKEEAMKEFIMLGLRKTTGINKNEFYRRFNTDIFERFPVIKQLINDGSVIDNNDFLYIKDEYFYISNHFIAKIIN